MGGCCSCVSRDLAHHSPHRCIDEQGVASHRAARERAECTSQRASHGIWAMCAFAFIYYVGNTFLAPFDLAKLDEWGCDILCQSTAQSLIGVLGLVGSFVMGRLSDKIGRRAAILLGSSGTLSSHLILLVSPTMNGYWLGFMPSALLDQNMMLLKAVVSDYFVSQSATVNGGSDEAQRAGAIGLLGFVGGIAMFVGSGFVTRIVSTFYTARVVAFGCTVASLPLVFLMPARDATKISESSAKSSPLGYIRQLTMLNVLKKPGAWMLLGARVSMALAFHIYFAASRKYLQDRFAFSAADQAQIMALCGIVYAVSQGFLAKRIIHSCTRTTSSGHADSSILLTCCAFVLGAGRIVIFITMDVRIVYACYGFMVTALGIANCIVNAAGAKLAGASETGGFYGLLESAEKLSGIVGPMLGGLLSWYFGIVLIAYAAASIYLVIAVLCKIFYHRLVEMDICSGDAGGGHSKED